MKSSVVVTETRVYTSEVMPEVSTSHAELGEVIAWADANPVAWKIVTQTRSAPFGKNSCDYMGIIRGRTDPQSVLDRVAYFKAQTERNFPPESPRARDNFFTWRAKFTLAHYADKGFRGGFFREYDADYSRNCVYLDYTPETKEAVIDRFLAWCSGYDAHFVTVDDVVVRIVKPGSRAKPPSRSVAPPKRKE